MNIPPKSESTSSNDVLKRARERFTYAAEAEADIRKDAVDDLKFFAGFQWPEDVKTARELDKRPCLTINRLPKFVRQVTNEQRQNRPAIKVNPVDDKGDVETAEILEGLIRHIEYDSNAETAYDTASDGQVRCGFGYFRIITEYCDPMSFEQKISIKRVRDAFSVYMDPDYTEPDGCDAKWAFVISSMSRDSYKQEYPGTDMSQMEDWSAVGSSTGGWASKDEVRIAEYYEKTFKTVKIVKLSDGQTVRKDRIPKELLEIIEGKVLPPEGMQVPQILEERETQVPRIMWYKINGIEILDETEVFGSHIPIIPVLGDEIFINGKRTLESIIRNAKDPQRMYNYWVTSATETIALAPRAPFIGAEGQFEGYEQDWRMANVRSQAFLQYKKVVSDSGQVLPPPQRNTFEPPVQAITQALQISAEDLKATTGIYDAELGNRSQEQSGVALQRRVNQSNLSNMHYGDNFKRSLRHAGRILIEMIPFVYDSAQAVRVLGADGEQKIVKINEIFMKQGQPTIYDLNRGEYDVTVDTGPSHQTKRQEAVADMIDLTKNYPQLMQFCGDLLVKNMDWPGAQEIADRLRKTLPPGMAEEKTDDKPPLPPDVQMAMQKMNHLLQQQSQLIAQQDEVIRTKKLELESRERIELQKQRTELVIEQMKHDAAHAQLGFKMDVDMIQKRLDLLNDNQPLVNGSPGPESGAGASNSQQQPPGGLPPA